MSDPAPRRVSHASHAPTIARMGAIAWPSFFAAGVATMVFFAIVDPVELAAMTWPHAKISREAGYTIGFFMFWACTFSSSFFTALLSGSPPDGLSAPDAR
jgi:hypothetical protein